MLSCATDFYACGKEAGKWLFGDRPFTVIPNGRDLGVYTFSDEGRARCRNELGVGSDKIVVGHVGMFNEPKNHARLIDIFSRLRKRSNRYLLCLIGDGPLRKSTEQKVEALGIEDSVVFLGRRTDVPDLLNAMDCMVLPSLYEGFPNVVLEWQLNGLPCVLSDTITDECAITPLVAFESLEQDDTRWADAIDQALLNSGRHRNSRLAAEVAKAKGYDVRDNAAMLKRFYLERASNESS